MNRLLMRLVGLLTAIAITLGGWPAWADAADKTTAYRVFQNDTMLREFAERHEAISYARSYLNSYVEDLRTREWIWQQFPTYQVYQKANKIGNAHFTLEQAIAEASKWANASVRHFEQPGWAWDNYAPVAAYRLYQGETTLPQWQFSSLEQAQREGEKWANAYILDVDLGKWVWDNLPAQSQSTTDDATVRYTVHNLSTSGSQEIQKHFSNLKEAVVYAIALDEAALVNPAKPDKPVLQHNRPYTVFQNNKPLKRFLSHHSAISYATQWANATVALNGQEIWTNAPYYEVHRQDRVEQRFARLQDALQAALQIERAVIRTRDGQSIWDNSNGLQFWAWNGSATDQTVQTYVNRTSGLDANSPTWFKLLDESGNVEDTSSASLTRWLKEQGLAVHPLIHNQFDSELTSRFLRNESGRKHFITQIVQRASELKLDGLNLDFESLSGSDREYFTQFVREFAQAAHAEGLIVSIDLPRGSLSWNHRTAFDHTALAEIVDYIMIMAYDQHYSGSEVPGSVAGLSWVETGIQEFLSYGIQRDQLILGIPFYVREWQLDAQGQLLSNRALYTRDLAKRLSDAPHEAEWDAKFEQYRITTNHEQGSKVFWLEDTDTVLARLELAKKYRLAGVAAWRLGQEPEDIWRAMLSKKH